MYNKAGEAYCKLLCQNLLDQSWHMIEIIMSSVLLNFSEHRLIPNGLPQHKLLYLSRDNLEDRMPLVCKQ